MPKILSDEIIKQKKKKNIVFLHTRSAAKEKWEKVDAELIIGGKFFW